MGAIPPSEATIPKSEWSSVIPTVLVAIICVSSTAAYEVAHDGNPVVPVDWGSVSDENLLYYYIYNPGRMDYSRFEWGGTVLHLGDRGARTSLDTDHLTLPVIAFDEFNLSDMGIVRERVASFFPEASVDEMNATSHLDGDWYDYVSFRNASVSIRIERRGSVEYDYRLDYAATGDDVVGSDERARAIAFDYLERHGGLPTDIGRMGGYHARQEYQVRYFVHIERSILGLPTHFDSSHARITINIDGRTGRVMSMQRGWPEARVAFYVTDLPSPASVVKHHGLNATAFEASDWDPLGNLTYMVSDQVFESPVPSVAGTTFMLPHWIAYETDPIWPWHVPTHFCNALFPDETVSS